MSQIEILNADDFITEEKPTKKIGAKPMMAISVLAGVGVVFLLIPHALIFGIVLLLIAGLAYFSFKNYVQIAIYKDYFVFFGSPQDNSRSCEKIKWEDIKEWKLDYNEGGPTSLIVTTQDGSVFVKSVLNWQSIWKAFHKMAEKSEQIEKHKKYLFDSNGINWRKKS